MNMKPTNFDKYGENTCVIFERKQLANDVVSLLIQQTDITNHRFISEQKIVPWTKDIQLLIASLANHRGKLVSEIFTEIRDEIYVVGWAFQKEVSHIVYSVINRHNLDFGGQRNMFVMKPYQMMTSVTLMSNNQFIKIIAPTITAKIGDACPYCKIGTIKSDGYYGDSIKMYCTNEKCEYVFHSHHFINQSGVK